MKPLKRFIPLFILLMTGLSISCGNDTNSINVKNWKILYEQDQALESVMQKSGWESVPAISNLKLPYAPINGFQYAWLKGEFEIAGDPENYYGLSTGKVILADKIFINDKFIGSLTPGKANWDPVPRNYVIPGDTLKTGNNIIYIQLGVYGGGSGGIFDEVLILSEETFNRDQLVCNLLYEHLPFGIIFLCIGFIISSMVSFIWDSNDKQYIYFPIILLLTVAQIFLHLPSYKLFNLELFMSISLSTGLLISLFYMIAFQESYRIYLSTFNRIIIPLYFLVVLFLLMSFNTSYFIQTFYIIQTLFFFITVPILVFIFYRLNSINRLIKKNRDVMSRFNTITVIIIFGLILISQAYFIAFRGYFPVHVLLFITPIFIIIWTVTEARKSRSKRLELELLYNKLKIFEGQDKDILITEASEEKLNRVIDFINENYTSDISREGLAAAVGINPNYMGTLFKAYKNEKINDYINRLRVEEAKLKLKSDNSRIIDIAFSVGFESIVTFNRAFKKATGVTPGEFKS